MGRGNKRLPLYDSVRLRIVLYPAGYLVNAVALMFLEISYLVTDEAFPRPSGVGGDASSGLCNVSAYLCRQQRDDASSVTSAASVTSALSYVGGRVIAETGQSLGV